MKQKPFVYIIGCLCLAMVLIQAPASAETKPARGATLVVPVETLSALIKDALPVLIDTDDRISGRLWIKEVNNLTLGKNLAATRIRLTGKAITYNEKIGGFKTSLQLGDVDVTFDCRAAIRYDRNKALLYIRPTIMPVKNKKDLVTPLLMVLFNETEYPLKIKKPQPIPAQLGKQGSEIHVNISNISTQQNQLLIDVSPRLKKTAS
ncbi:MAG: hypothetical protein H8D81_00400 [Deltaproteobacteria bacterium]|nr:hypothetical protein [Deltaproteobacteria bacterium]